MATSCLGSQGCFILEQHRSPWHHPPGLPRELSQFQLLCGGSLSPGQGLWGSVSVGQPMLLRSSSSSRTKYLVVSNAPTQEPPLDYSLQKPSYLNEHCSLTSLKKRNKQTEEPEKLRLLTTTISYSSGKDSFYEVSFKVLFTSAEKFQASFQDMARNAWQSLLDHLFTINALLY